MQILSRAIDTFRSEAYLSRPSSPTHYSASTSTTAFPDLVHVFSKQLAEWRSATQLSVRSCRIDDDSERFLVGNLKMYEGYARLVVHSFGLERAIREPHSPSLPASFAEVSHSNEVC